MNKELIELALQKLNEAFATIKPGAIDLGQQYVDYMVYKCTLRFYFSFGVMSILFMSFLISVVLNIKYYKKYGEDDTLTIITSFIFIMSIIFFIIGGLIDFLPAFLDFLLAQKYPVIYAIKQLTRV